MSLLETIRLHAQSQAPEVIRWRRHLHAHPELSFQEVKTGQFVADALREMGLSPQTGVAGTGVVALVEGKKPAGKIIALRADMDALPIQEINEVPYRSQNPGVMHACGHDVHTTSLLGTALILSKVRDQFEGTVKLIFQPGEEKNPGGASLMIRDGVLKNPAPSGIIGQHVMPLLPVGKVGFREGMYMASSDEIYLNVVGKGGHAGAPELLVDPVVIASHILVALQQVVSRQANPRQATVLSFGKVIANGATNVIPGEVAIAGTFRALDETWRADGLRKIEVMAKGIAESMGGHCEVTISRGYPHLDNNPDLTRRIRLAAEAYVGKENVVTLDITLGSEDFSFYSHEIPASFYRLGTRNESKHITSYVHTPTFDIDEGALALGPGLMAWLAICELGAPN